MPLITLTTDFGTKDHSVAAIKGAIYSEIPEAKVVDITHEITPFSVIEASYILKNAYKHFPKGSIHIIGVDSELSVEQKHIALEIDGHYFICADNGVISLITSNITPTEIYEINLRDGIDTSFPTLDIFVKVANYIACGGVLSVVGKRITNFKILKETEPKIDANIIVGNVIYIDNYGNVISNISKEKFEMVCKGRPYKIIAKDKEFKKTYTKYNEIVDFSIPKEKRLVDGEKLVLFNSGGYLEIAIYKSNKKTYGSASTLLGLYYRDKITIEFQ